MNYTYCERLMWVAIAPAAFRYLARQELGWDISALKQLSKQIYRQMVSRTPDIGSMMENPLRVCLTGGILWLSIYKAAEEKMSEKRFEGMVSGQYAFSSGCGRLPGQSQDCIYFEGSI